LLPERDVSPGRIRPGAASSDGADKENPRLSKSIVDDSTTTPIESDVVASDETGDATEYATEAT
jgi:hypothetical protein